MQDDQTTEQVRRDRDDAGEELVAENLRLKEELLVARDTIVGQEARLGEALGEVRRLEAELVRYRDSVEELDRIERSPLGKARRVLRALRALSRRPG
jgi:hypothetical protein